MGRLEAAETRSDVIKTASDICAENAALGMKWKDLAKDEKGKFFHLLTNPEMQFLFTETLPAHYTPKMIVAKLSYAHSGESRQITEALLKGEIKPSPKARKLIESLEAKLQRPELKDSILATKHFFKSLKRTKSNEKTTIEIKLIEIKLSENALLQAETYRELLERFYPNDERENEKFKFSASHEKTLAEARIKGQDEAIKQRQAEICTKGNFLARENGT